MAERRGSGDLPPILASNDGSDEAILQDPEIDYAFWNEMELQVSREFEDAAAEAQATIGCTAGEARALVDDNLLCISSVSPSMFVTSNNRALVCFEK